MHRIGTQVETSDLRLTPANFLGSRGGRGADVEHAIFLLKSETRPTQREAHDTFLLLLLLLFYPTGELTHGNSTEKMKQNTLSIQPLLILFTLEDGEGHTPSPCVLPHREGLETHTPPPFRKRQQLGMFSIILLLHILSISVAVYNAKIYVGKKQYTKYWLY